MKAVFNCHHDRVSILESFIQGEAVYLLPVLNKPLLGYLLDFCSLAGIADVLIVDSEYDMRIEEYLGSGTKWNLKISYLGDNTGDDPTCLLSKHRNFASADEDILIFNGLFFLHYDQRAIRPFPEVGRKMAKETDEGIFIYSGEKLSALDSRVTPIRDVRSYFNLNMFLMDNELDNYVIPGYNIENGVYTGMNDVIPPDCEIRAPVILGDNIRFADGCLIDGYAVLGENVIADSRCTISRSIIFPNTYLGSDLEFIDKIVVYNCVIDPRTDTIINLLDAQIAGELQFNENRAFFYHFSHWFFTFFLVISALLPYLFFRFVLGVKYDSFHYFFTNFRSRPRRKIPYPFFPENIRLRRMRYFHALSLDKFPLLLHVLAGRLRLIGDYPYDAIEPGIEDFVCKNYEDYHAGVFSLSELQGHGGLLASRLINDHFFEHNRSFTLELSIIIRFYIGRLFINYGDKS